MLNQGNTSFDFDQDSLDHNQDSDDQFEVIKPPSAFPANKEPRSNNQNTLKLDRPKATKEKKSYSEHLSYDLTFKKDNTSMFTFNVQKAEGARQNLFHSPVQNPENNAKTGSPYTINAEQSANKFKSSYMYQILNKQTSVNGIQQKLLELSIDVHQGLAQVESLAHMNRDRQSLAIIQNLQSLSKVKNLRRKRNSARINLLIMKSAASQLGKQLSEGEKKRQQILSLLKVQLEKKLFIECFKLGRIQRICKQIFRKRKEKMYQMEDQEIGSDPEQNNESQVSDNQFLHQQLFGVEDANGKDNPLQTSHKNQPLPQWNPYLQKSRITVFCQIISSLLKKQKYSCYKKLLNNKIRENIQEQSSKEQEQEKDYRQNQQLDCQIFGEDMNEEQAGKEKENPAVQIKCYIEQLKSEFIRQPKLPEQLIRNYFLKWKIYFLNRILQKISNNDQLDEDDAENFNQKQPNPFMIYSSVKSNQNDLKEQKKRLKLYLAISRIKQFFNIIKERLAQKRIQQVTGAYHNKNLLQKYFSILYSMKQETKALQYAQQVAALQDEDQLTTCVIFSKTNLITKAFFGLKRWVQTKKWITVTQKSVIAYTFRCLKFVLIEEEANQRKLQKFLQRKKRKLIFKYFCGMKSISSMHSMKYQLDQLKNKKDMELKQLCFSALSLQYKKRLNSIKRVRQHICTRQVLWFLSTLKGNLEQRYYAENKMIEKSLVSKKKSKKFFFNRLRLQYAQALKRKRISIKQVKLHVLLSKNQTKQFLKRWRKITICNFNYRLIQAKLRKLKQLEIKQSLFHIWMNRFGQKRREKKNDRHTGNHKIWLSKYYQKLCALENSEIS